MEHQKTQRLLVWSIIVLVTLNIISLSALWYRGCSDQRRPRSRQQGARLEDLIIREVGLSQEQASQFRELHDRHRRVKDSLDSELYNLKQQIQKEMFSTSPDTVRLVSLADQFGRVQGEFERQVDRHFLQVKALCSPDQYPKLESLLSEILSTLKPGPPPQTKEGREPGQRGPRDDRRPPPRPESNH